MNSKSISITYITLGIILTSVIGTLTSFISTLITIILDIETWNFHHLIIFLMVVIFVVGIVVFIIKKLEYNKREKDTLNEAPKNETKKNKTISISRKKIRVFYITILIVFVILSLLISILIVQKQRYFHFLDGENNRLRKLSEVEEIFRSDNISDTKTHSHKMIVGFIYDPYITESNYKPDNLIKYKKLNKDILNSLKEFSKDPTILTVEIDSIPFDLRNLRNNTKRTLDSLNNKRIENNMQRINIFVWNDFL